MSFTSIKIVAWNIDRWGVSTTVYYQGWWHQYAEPMYSPNIKDALVMSDSGARNAVKRLNDPKVWGVKAYIVKLPN